MADGARRKNPEIHVRERSTEPKPGDGWGEFRMKGCSDYSRYGLSALFGAAERRISFFLFEMFGFEILIQRCSRIRACFYIQNIYYIYIYIYRCKNMLLRFYVQ
jgi:hypothetical protein